MPQQQRIGSRTHGPLQLVALSIEGRWSNLGAFSWMQKYQITMILTLAASCRRGGWEKYQARKAFAVLTKPPCDITLHRMLDRATACMALQSMLQAFHRFFMPRKGHDDEAALRSHGLCLLGWLLQQKLLADKFGLFRLRLEQLQGRINLLQSRQRSGRVPCDLQRRKPLALMDPRPTERIYVSLKHREYNHTHAPWQRLSACNWAQRRHARRRCGDPETLCAQAEKSPDLTVLRIWCANSMTPVGASTSFTVCTKSCTRASRSQPH